jgi:WD40 repeat protein
VQKVHGLDEDHTKAIKDMCVVPNVKLAATVALDGIVKIWNLRDNSLLREIPITDNNISHLTFANERGDLLLGNAREILLVRIQDYMPPYFLRDMIECSFEDDLLESGPYFDSELDFWEIFIDKLDEEALASWHTAVT